MHHGHGLIASVLGPVCERRSEENLGDDDNANNAVTHTGDKSVPAQQDFQRQQSGAAQQQAGGAPVHLSTASTSYASQSSTSHNPSSSTSSRTQVGGSSSSSSGKHPGGPKPIKGELTSYAFFAKYTYTTECALLAYNFHEIVNQLGIFDFFSYKHDHRLVSVTLAYLFYKYQIHHCDMALDLALTLCYLEDLTATELLENFQDGDAFNVICYLAFLAHVFNADRTIRLKDWYSEIGWRHFPTVKKLNAFVFFLFSKVRKFRLQVSESRVKKYIQKLCSVPVKQPGGAQQGGAP
ncbi:unnamed protein product [Amoebophrya sp. A25]|nr:unnamed protein product [Amoebophrya sp. A25]|eukprot:GSA25T00000959001.1